MTVGDRIRSLRESNGWSQQDLANRVGYKHKSSINKIEKSRDLPLDKVQKVALALDVSPSVLMGWTDDRSVDGAKDAKFLRLFHSLSERDQEIIIQTMRTMSKTDLL